MSAGIIIDTDDAREFLCAIFFNVETNKLEIEVQKGRDPLEVVAMLSKFNITGIVTKGK